MGAQEHAYATGLPRSCRTHSRGISGGWKKENGGSLQASCQGECFHLRPWYFSPGACTKSPELLSLFFCALQGSTGSRVGGGTQECTQCSPSCTSSTQSPTTGQYLPQRWDPQAPQPHGHRDGAGQPLSSASPSHSAPGNRFLLPQHHVRRYGTSWLPVGQPFTPVAFCPS